MDLARLPSPAEALAKPSVTGFLQVVFKREIRVLLFFVATVCIVAVSCLTAKLTHGANPQILIKVGRGSIYVPTLLANGSSNRVSILNKEVKIHPTIPHHDEGN